MASPSILHRCATDVAIYSGGSWRPSLPLINLAHRDPMRVARSTDLQLTSTCWRTDHGEAPLQGFTEWNLLRSNLTTSALVRIRVSNSATDAAAGLVYDSQWLPAWEPTVIWGAVPWGLFPFDGVDTEAYPGGYMMRHEVPRIGGSPDIKIGRYVFVYIDDRTNPAGYVQIGRYMGGWASSPNINCAWGNNIEVIDLSEATRTRGGNLIVDERPRYRQFELAFPYLTKAEAFGIAEPVNRVLGKAGQMVITVDPDEEAAYRYRRSLYCSLVGTAKIIETSEDAWSWTLNVQEIT